MKKIYAFFLLLSGFGLLAGQQNCISKSRGIEWENSTGKKPPFRSANGNRWNLIQFFR
jgi:hypothetical protein